MVNSNANDESWHDSSRKVDYTGSILVELSPSDTGLRDLVRSKGTSDQFMGDPVKCLLQVQERHVDFLVFLSMFLHEYLSNVDSIGHSASLGKKRIDLG